VTLHPLGAGYCECVQGSHDAAIVDGRLRVKCCERAMQALKSGGILLLDNAERKQYQKARTMLAHWSVIETNNGIWHTNIWIKP
jgi:predicted O-methyltransferase YrrM